MRILPELKAIHRFALAAAGFLAAAAGGAEVCSPDGALRVSFSLEGGRPHWSVTRGGEAILAASPLGLTFVASQGGSLRDLRVVGERRREWDTTWRPVWGTASEVRDHGRELVLELVEAGGPRPRQIDVVLRVYDDGVALRYELPTQAALDTLALLSEDTELRLAGDWRAWWIPADEFAYESLHRDTPLSGIDHANTPLTLVTDRGTWISIHEAALVDYSELTLRRTADTSFTVHLWPWPDGVTVRGRAPFVTPWRVLQISSRLAGLAESHLLANLNDPCVLDDTSWITPMTFVGIWWGMHQGDWTWHDGPRHGATTARAKEYIDFAAAHGIGGVLAEGWNRGWETWGHGESIQDFCTSYPDFDLGEVVRHAHERGVAFIGHHETGGNVPMYEAQLDSAFALCARLGIPAVKTGYAGPIVPAGMHHHGQSMVRHFARVVETAARHRVMLDVHEGIKPTGLERTWPNLMSTEAVRGMEWNATLNKNPPRHATILPFTRFLAGPADATPGIFRLDGVPATLANQLALYVVFHSPLAMAADRVENYANEPAFAFIAQMPCTWDETRVVDAALGDHATFARRAGDVWYLGSVADEEVRELALPLSFLAPDGRYRAELYVDPLSTDRPVDMVTCFATAADTLRAVLARAGGLAARFVPDSGAAGDLPPIATINATTAARRAAFAAAPRPLDSAVSHLAVGAAVQLRAAPSPRYALGALTDGVLASGGFQDQAWLGFEGVDLEATIDLGQATTVHEVTLHCLDDLASWVQLPVLVEIATSLDGRTFTVAAAMRDGIEAGGRPALLPLRATFTPHPARFLRARAVQRPLPVGHAGHGSAGWLFFGEIEVH